MKKQYYADYFASNINNTKKTWDGIREIVNLKKNHTQTSQLIIGGKIIDDDQELATNLNEFFVNVGPSTENNISPTKFLKNRN